MNSELFPVLNQGLTWEILGAGSSERFVGPSVMAHDSPHTTTMGNQGGNGREEGLREGEGNWDFCEMLTL